MTAASPPKGPPPQPPSFLEGCVAHLRSFAARAGVSPSQVAVRLTLADGSVMSTNGLKLTPATAGGWGMIDGLGQDESEAVVLRESSVFKVEFALRTPSTRPPIGFSGETATA